MRLPCLAILSFLALALGTDAEAAFITVNTPSDQFGEASTECSLREAVQAANTDAAFGGCVAGTAGSDAILLPVRPGGNVNYNLSKVGGGEDNNATGDLDIRTPMSILGLAVDGGDLDPEMVELECRTDRCFHVFSGGSLRLVSMTLSGGDVTGFDDDDGGLIRRQFAGILDLENVVLREGRAQNGGAIAESGSGTTTMDNVSIIDNRAAGGAGWYHIGTGTAQLNNVTFSGNVASVTGGAILLTGPAVLRHLTVANNGALDAAGRGGGLRYVGNGDNTGIQIFNSVFAGNWAGASPGAADDVNCSGNMLGTRGHSLIQRGACAHSAIAGPQLTGEARLAPLFEYGRGMPTHALLDGSPLINAGGNGTLGAACLPTDARGVARSANQCDIGAYERVINHTVNSAADFPDTNPGNGICATSNGLCTLRAAIDEARATVGPQMIRVPAGDYAVSTVALGSIALWPITSARPRAITLLGDVEAPASVGIRMVGQGAAFDLLGPQGDDEIERRTIPALALLGISISDANRQAIGSVPGTGIVDSGGALRVRASNLLVYRSILRNNRVTNGHGGAIGLVRGFDTTRRRATVTVEASALLDNVARAQGGLGGGGGAIAAITEAGLFERDPLRVRNSTLSGNRADGEGGAILGIGRVMFSTIVGNQASNGGGLFRRALLPGELYLGNSVVAGNTRLLGSGGPDCATNGGTFSPIITLGYNLIGDATECARNGDVATDLVNPVPQVGARRSDLGPAPAHFPLPGSAIVNAIPRERCLDFLDGQRWLTDQNGDPRLSLSLNAPAAFCDIGAVEGPVAPLSDELFGNGFESPTP
jgi:CSLREA domain-containing protein